MRTTTIMMLSTLFKQYLQKDTKYVSEPNDSVLAEQQTSWYHPATNRVVVGTCSLNFIDYEAHRCVSQ